MDEEIESEITCERCGGSIFDLLPKKIKKDGKILQKIICVLCGEWILVGDLKDSQHH